MKPEARARVLEAAKRGQISFFERPTHETIEFDVSGEPIKVVHTHGVCRGCVWSIEMRPREEHTRCAREDAYARCATVDEVAAWLELENPEL